MDDQLGRIRKWMRDPENDFASFLIIIMVIWGTGMGILSFLIHLFHRIPR